MTQYMEKIASSSIFYQYFYLFFNFKYYFDIFFLKMKISLWVYDKATLLSLNGIHADITVASR